MISGMEVKEDDEDFLNAVDYMFKGLEQRKPNCFAAKQYKKYKLSSGQAQPQRNLYRLQGGRAGRGALRRGRGHPQL